MSLVKSYRQQYRQICAARDELRALCGLVGWEQIRVDSIGQPARWVYKEGNDTRAAITSDPSRDEVAIWFDIPGTMKIINHVEALKYFKEHYDAFQESVRCRDVDNTDGV